MALSILDGNQSATTLSTILSSGQHITAHTVISLGTQAIADIVNATSANLTNTQLRASAVTVGGTVTVGNSLTISSLPAISGTVTANAGNGFTNAVVDGLSDFISDEGVMPISGTINSNILVYNAQTDDPKQVRGYSNGGQGVCLEVCGPSINGVTVGGIPGVPVFGTVTVGNTVTIAGTVTANPTGTQTIAGTVTIGAGTSQIGSVTASISNFPATQAVSLTTLPALVAGTAQIGSVTASISGTVPISISSVTIGSLPAISGTVTANTFAIQGTAVTTSNFTSTTASTVLASFNATRQVLTIFNEGAGNLHICAGATCTTIAYQVRLSSGDYYEVPNHQTTITHSAVFATAGTARVTEVS